MKIKIVNEEGARPGYTMGFVRVLGMLLSSFALCLGWLWILISKDRLGWHDKIAKTYPIDERAPAIIEKEPAKNYGDIRDERN